MTMLGTLKKLLVLNTPTATYTPPARITSDAEIDFWQPTVIVHPQYWIGSNFYLVEKLPPFLKRFFEFALRNKYIVDLSMELTLDTVKFLHETVVIQLGSHLTTEDGKWTVVTKNSIIQVRAELTAEASWPNLMRAWTVIQEIIVQSGLTLSGIEEEWDRQNLIGSVKIPTNKLNFSTESSLLWNVLYRNKNRVILWNSKLWVPKNT